MEGRVYLFVCTFSCMCVCVNISWVRVFVFVCLCVCVCVWLATMCGMCGWGVWMCIAKEFVGIYVVYTHMYVCTCTQRLTHALIHKHINTHIRKKKHIH